jgi:Tol biopolymer transport system component
VWSDFEAPEEITGLQVSGEMWGPALSADRLTLYFAENDGNDERIMQATRSDLGPNFSPAVEVPNVQSTAYDGTPFVSADGLELYLFSLRPGGVGNRDLWIARRTSPTGSFAAPTLLPIVNSAAADHLPRLSADGLTLMFASGRVTNPGGTDIWQAQRASLSSSFGTPTLVSELSTSDYEAAASLSSDRLTIIFSSNRPGGLGDNDLWFATRSDGSGRFGPARNLTIANSDSSEADCVLSADDHELIFASARSGTRKLWRVVQTCR